MGEQGGPKALPGPVDRRVTETEFPRCLVGRKVGGGGWKVGNHDGAYAGK